MISRQGQSEFLLVDLGSSNGTRLNGKHVSKPCLLADGDRIEVGGLIYAFRTGTSAISREVNRAGIESTITEVRSFKCWFLIADIVGSTQMAQSLPQDKSAALIADWLRQCKAIIDDNHGAINKYLGDGFFAYWPEITGVARRVTGALEALKAMQTGSPAPFRLVLHYGSAMSGGRFSQGEENLSGKHVIFTFRMEELAGSLGAAVLISRDAAASLGPLRMLSAGVHCVRDFETPTEFFTF